MVTSAAAAVYASASSAAFTLPDGWRVEKKPRKVTEMPSHVDKFYIEPGTRKKFRSLKEVQRHLNGEEVRRKRPSSSSASCSRKRDKLPAPSYDEVPQSVNWRLVSLGETHTLKAYIDGRGGGLARMGGVCWDSEVSEVGLGLSGHEEEYTDVRKCSLSSHRDQQPALSGSTWSWVPRSLKEVQWHLNGEEVRRKRISSSSASCSLKAFCAFFWIFFSERCSNEERILCHCLSYSCKHVSPLVNG